MLAEFEGILQVSSLLAALGSAFKPPVLGFALFGRRARALPWWLLLDDESETMFELWPGARLKSLPVAGWWALPVGPRNASLGSSICE